MDDRTRRRERLHRLIDLALAAKRASKAGLAGYFARDRRHLYPDTDNPKLDLLVALSDALEWPLEAVVDFIWRGTEDVERVPEGADYATLDEQAVAAHHRGDFPTMVSLSRCMFQVAKTPAQRARACRLEGVGWANQGRFGRAMAAFRRGRYEPGVATAEQLALEVNIANAYYTLWDLASARGVAHVVVDHFDKQKYPPRSRTDMASRAFALYVRGNSLRRMLALRPTNAHDIVANARRDLVAAERAYSELFARYDFDQHAAIANTCRGGMLELDVELGRRSAREAIDQILAALPRNGLQPPGCSADWLESYGWWCDAGANIALRHLSGELQERYLAILCEKLLEIGCRLGNWHLIERAVSIEYGLVSSPSGAADRQLAAVLDTEDLRLLVGVLGRFPHVRERALHLVSDGVVTTSPRRESWNSRRWSVAGARLSLRRAFQ